MEGPSNYNDSMQLMSLNFGGNAVNDEPNQEISVAIVRTANQIDALSLPGLTKTAVPSHSFVEYLAESSTFLSNAPCEDMFESIPSYATGIHDVGGVSDFRREMLYNSLGNGRGSNSTEFSVDMDTWQLLRNLRPYNELVNTQPQIPTQYHTTRKYHSNWDSYDSVSQADSRARISAPCFLSQPLHNAAKQRSLDSRSRRMRVAKNLTALQELLPDSAEGDQVSVVDDVIDHIKLLQLQIKDLCKSRLGGESITDPIICREGFGHYFCHQQMLNEPLEEILGKLLETNPMAAYQLLEDKGLLLLPMDYSGQLA